MNTMTIPNAMNMAVSVRQNMSNNKRVALSGLGLICAFILALSASGQSLPDDCSYYDTTTVPSLVHNMYY